MAECNRVVVLSGSGSDAIDGVGEPLISSKTAINIVDSLHDAGYLVERMVFNEATFLQEIAQIGDAVVFNAMHGKYGEDGVVPFILDNFQIPYTHSGSLASSIAFNKHCVKKYMPDIPFISGFFVHKSDLISGQYKAKLKMLNGSKFILKPVADGSSMGVQVFYRDKEIDLSQLGKHDDFLIEEFIVGREINVAIFGDKVIGSMEVVYSDEIFSYDNKYNDATTQHIMPVSMDASSIRRMYKIAEDLHSGLGCKDVSRTEFKLCPDGQIFVIEINTHPGFTSTSIVPEIALNNGIDPGRILSDMCQAASYNKLNVNSIHESFAWYVKCVDQALHDAVRLSKVNADVRFDIQKSLRFAITK